TAMNISKYTDFIIDILSENKATDVLRLDVRKRTSTVDYMVVASGSSSRHIKALSEILVEESKKIRMPSVGIEGENGSDWILIDFQDILVHLMLPRVREFYNIEKLWSLHSIEKQSATES
ncbi:MAG TPA: ribosome silencing factor, partial [Woeseiaceae bacterium]|nr:ribosome silencing factor [Woeseiaceae bacterium]